MGNLESCSALSRIQCLLKNALVRAKQCVLLSALMVIAACGGGSEPTVNFPGTNGPSGNVGNPVGQPQTLPVISNSAPVADAGRTQRVLVSSLVELDGTKSQADNSAITYNWTLSSPIGSKARLEAENSPRPRFMPDVEGIYYAFLKISNGKTESKASSVMIVASDAEVTPVANAGEPQIVKKSSIVYLNGSKSSDANGDAISYEWSFAKVPAASKSKLELQRTAKPLFVADTVGTYAIRLVVSDGKNLSDPDEIEVTVSEGAIQPIADPGPDQAVVVGREVTIDGSSSLNYGAGSLVYKWILINKPAGSNADLRSSTSRSFFTADRQGLYVICLTVNDGVADSISKCIVVTATSQEGSPPIAVIGQTPISPAGNSITLDGTRSIASGGRALTYAWNIQSKPLGSAAIISNPTSSNPDIRTDVKGDYIVSLRVSDSTQTSLVASTTVKAESPPDLAYLRGRVTLRFKDAATLTYDPSNRYVVDLYSPSILTDPVSISARPRESVTSTIQTTVTCSAFYYPKFTSIPTGYAYSCDVVWTTFRKIFVFKINPDRSLEGVYRTCSDELQTRQSCLNSLLISSNPGSMNGQVESLTSSVNMEPVANAQGSQSVRVGSYAFLNGVSSFDPEGNQLSFSWILRSKPISSAAQLGNASSSTPYLIPDVAGDYVVSLTVGDGSLNSSNNSDVTVIAVEGLLTSSISNGNSSSCCRVCTIGKACGDSCI